MIKPLLLTAAAFLAITFSFAQSGRVGIGTSNPKTKLDVAGAISTSEQAAPAASNLSINSNVSLFRITLVGGAQTNSVSAISPAEGQLLIIVNEDNDDALFAGSTIKGNGGSNSYIYANGNWRLTGTSQVNGGPTGPKGDTGNTGPVGATGAVGAQGIQGITGPQGLQGVKGDKGDKGDTGNAGAKGDKGDKGDQGNTGTQGPQGNVGPAPSGTGIVTVNGGTLQTPGQLSGDVTTSGSGLAATIANDAVTNSKLSNMAQNTLKGRVSSGSGDPEDLTPTQVKTMLGLSNGVNGSGTLNYVSKWTPDGATIGNSQIFDNGTNVGIGDASPNAPLTIKAASTGDQALFQSWRYTDTSDQYALKLKQTVTGGVVRYTYDMINNNTAYNNVLTFDRGNVGIGQVDPTEKLHIEGKIKMVDGNQSAGKVMTSDASGTGTWQAPKYNAYKIPNTTGSAQWIKLGTLTIGQQGKSAFFKIISNTGYNASNAQNYEVYLRFKTSNVSSIDANGFAGDASYWYTGSNGLFASSGNIKIKGNAAGGSATAYDIFVYFGAYTGDGSFYTVEMTEGIWVHSGTTGQADPGAASSTVLVVPLKNPISVGVPIGSIIAWHKSGADVPSLPNGWVECSGGIVSDGDSPIYGMTIPNLNSGADSPFESGTNNGGRYLRGATTSGTMQNDQIPTFEINQNDSDSGVENGSVYADGKNTNYSGWLNQYYSSDRIRIRYTESQQVQPLSMTVVWIMRIK